MGYQRANTKTSKTPRLPVYNNNGVKPKHWRCNVPSKTLVTPSPIATDIRENKKKHFKRGTIKQEYTDKFLKLLIYNPKSAKSNKTMGFLHAKNNTKWS